MEVIGRIAIENPICDMCGTTISVWKYSDNIKCGCCGAVYISVVNKGVQDQYTKYDFKFKHFECLHKTAIDDCKNVCPAPNMYCIDHITDEHFDKLKDSVKYYENQIKKIKEILDAMEESKKTWLVKEMSGI